MVPCLLYRSESKTTAGRLSAELKNVDVHLKPPHTNVLFRSEGALILLFGRFHLTGTEMVFSYKWLANLLQQEEIDILHECACFLQGV